jgi:hypothetical protein
MKTLRSVLFVFAALFMATAAHAEGQKVTAYVPFDFVVGDRAYPAGEYSLEAIAGTGAVIRIENADRAQEADGSVLSHACTSIVPSEKTKLVFHRMGDALFLSQVWIQGNTYGREFSKSKTEIQLAGNNLKSETVIVAANLTK